MSERLLKILINETNKSIQSELERTQSEAWKDNVFVKKPESREYAS